MSHSFLAALHTAVDFLGQGGKELLQHQQLQDLLHGVLLRPKPPTHGKAPGATKRFLQGPTAEFTEVQV